MLRWPGHAALIRQILRDRLPLAVLDLAQHRTIGAEMLGRRKFLLVAAEEVGWDREARQRLGERVGMEILAGILRRLNEQAGQLIAVGRQDRGIFLVLVLVA